MFIKFMGAVFIIVSSGLFGFYFSFRDKYRLLDLAEAKRLLSMLEGEILYLASPLPQAFLSAAKRTSGTVSLVAEEMAQSLFQRDKGSAGELWRETLLKHRKETYFQEEDLKILFAFGETLGYLDQVQQKKHIDLALLELGTVEERLRREYEKMAKVYRSMGVLSGILIVVVLF